MIYRTANNASVSLLGYGTMRFPLTAEGKIDREKAFKLIDTAYQNGVNYYDTAFMYHGGESEQFLGEALKRYPRDSFFLTSKLPIWMAETPADMERIFEKQLEKLQTGYFDFYLLHALGKANWERCEAFGAYDFIVQKKKEGKIRHIGFSFHDSPEMLETIVQKGGWEVAQLQLNYLDWDMQNAKRQYEILEQAHIPCIVMEPVRGGVLANPCDEANAIFKAADPDASVASWAIRFAASLPNVMTVLSGMTTMEQLCDNLKTMDPFRPVDSADQAVIENAVAAYRKQHTVPCTGCNYCADCPMEIEISKVFKLFNDLANSKNKNNFKAGYEQTKTEGCIDCGRCASVCPQKIDVPDRLRHVANAYQNL